MREINRFILLATIFIVSTISVFAYSDIQSIDVRDNPAYINIKDSPVFSFTTVCYDGALFPMNAMTHKADVVDKQGVTLKSLDMIQLDKGVYYFNYDFSKLPTDNYIINVVCDGVSEKLSLKTVEYPPALGMFYENGGVNEKKVVVASIMCFVLIGLLILAIILLTITKKGKKR